MNQDQLRKLSQLILQAQLIAKELPVKGNDQVWRIVNGLIDASDSTLNLLEA